MKGRQLLRLAALGGSVKIAGTALGVLFFLVLARHMASAEYGRFAVSFALATVLGFAGTFGQHVAILRFAPEADAKFGRAAAGAVVMHSLWLAAKASCGVLALTCAVALGANFLPGNSYTPAFFVATGLLAAALSFSEVVIAATRAIGNMGASLVPREIVWRVLVIAGAIASGDALSFGWVMTLVAGGLFLVTVPQFVSLWRMARGDVPTPAVAQLKQDMRRSQWGFWGAGVGGPITAQAGTVIIGMVLGPVVAGAFFVADRLAKLLSLGLVAINLSSGPAIARAFALDDRERVKAITASASLAASAVSMLGYLVFIAFGHLLLQLFDDSYGYAYVALLILAAGQVVNNVCGPNGLLLTIGGHERAYMNIVFLWGILGIALAAAGAYSGGIVGCSVAVSVIAVAWNIHAVAKCQELLSINPLSLRDRPWLRSVLGGKV